MRAGVCDGFIGNRILAHYRKAADYMMMDGASPEQIDRALEEFGFAMGPFAVSDLAGLDIGWATRKRQATTRPADERYAGQVADRICEEGLVRAQDRQGLLHLRGQASAARTPRSKRSSPRSGRRPASRRASSPTMRSSIAT